MRMTIFNDISAIFNGQTNKKRRRSVSEVTFGAHLQNLLKLFEAFMNSELMPLPTIPAQRKIKELIIY